MNQNAFPYDRKSAEKFISSLLEYMILRHFTIQKLFFYIMTIKPDFVFAILS